LWAAARGNTIRAEIDRRFINGLPRGGRGFGLGRLLGARPRSPGLRRRRQEILHSLHTLLERLGLANAPAGEDEYHAFISYSHADSSVAPALQRGLQRFAKPWYQAKALRIFRDEASLSADPGLWSSIAHGIESSQHFILLASTDAAASEWVGREVEHWYRSKTSPNILIVLTQGELAWDKGAGDFDWKRTTALPACLHGVFGEEPRHIDLRWARSETDLSLSHARFRDAIAELAAPLHGRPKDEIAGEEVRQHRRTVRIARLAAAGLLGLTALTTAAAILAVVARNDAVAQRKSAVSRLLASQAVSQLGTSLDAGALMSVAALREEQTPEAKSSVVLAVQRTDSVLSYLRRARSGLFTASASADGRLMAASDDGGLTVWDLIRNRPIPLAAAAKHRVSEVALSPDGAFLATRTGTSVTVWPLHRPGGAESPRVVKVSSMAFGPGALALGTADGRIALWSPAHGVVSQIRLGRDLQVNALAFSADGRSLAAAAGLAGLFVIRYGPNGAPAGRRRLGPHTVFQDVAFGRGARTLAAAMGGGDVLVWDLDRDASAQKLTSGTRVAVAADGTIATGNDAGTIELWSAAAGHLPIQQFNGDEAQLAELAFSGDGRTLSSASSDGAIVRWRVSGTPLRTIVRPFADAGYSTLRGVGFLSPTRLVSAADGSVVIHDLATRSSRDLPNAPLGRMALAVDPPRHAVAVADAGPRVVLWENATARKPRFRMLRTGGEGALAVAFSTDGNLLAAGTDHGDVAIWDLRAAGDKPRTIPTGPGPDLSIRALGFDRLGHRLAVGRPDGSVVVLDVARGTIVAKPRKSGRVVTAVAFSPSGDVLAFGGFEKRVTIWDSSTKRARSVSEPVVGYLTDLAFTPNGDALAWSESTGRIVLWDVRHDRSLGDALQDDPGGVAAIDFRADGAVLAAGRNSGTVALWDGTFWDVDRAARRLCTIFGQTQATEWRDALRAGSTRSPC
jgi:WD40 repeat protein